MHLTPWALLPLLAVVVIATTARHLWSQRREPGAGSLIALALASAWWAFAQILILSVGNAETALTLSRLQYFGIAGAPLAWFWFALDYTGRGALLRGPLGLVAIVPVTTVFLAFTNESHHLLWAAVTPRPGDVGGIVVEHGPWFSIQAAIAYLFVLAATGVLIWHHAQSPRYRARILVAVAAPAAVLLPNLLYLSPLQPTEWIDLTPTGFAVAIAVLGWGLLRQGQLVMAPVARTIVVEEMRDPILVLDRRGQIVDLNRAAEDVLGLEAEGDVPVTLGTNWAVGHRRAREGVLPPERIELETAAGERRTFEMTMTALGPRGGSGRSVIVLRDVTDRERMQRELLEKTEALGVMNAELERLANTDVLTGLSNRRHFMTALEREVERAERYGRPLSLVLLDLDHFKRVNDSWGHPAGDAVLRASGRALREVSREIDVPARIGGEELALILPETDAGGARVVAERLRTGIAGGRHEGPDGQTFRVTASLGVAVLGGEVGSGEALLHAADQALYEAKERGRDQVVVGTREDEQLTLPTPGRDA